MINLFNDMKHIFYDEHGTLQSELLPKLLTSKNVDYQHYNYVFFSFFGYGDSTYQKDVWDLLYNTFNNNRRRILW